MNELLKVFDLDLVQIMTGIIILAIAWSKGIELYDKIRDRLGIETPSMRDKKDKTGALQRLAELETQLLKIAKNSEKYDAQLRESINRLRDSMEEHMGKDHQRRYEDFHV